MKWNILRTVCAVLIAFFVLIPESTWAYSYGDPNQEDIAVSFKEIAVELDQNPMNWSKAEEIYKIRRAEISSHFGEDVAQLIETNINDKNKEFVFTNYKALLVLNLERRFTYALRDFDEYAQAKLLVAKAKGTYDVLKPYIPSDQTDTLDNAFNQAYVALGNPGLFGVGAKASDKAAFTNEIDTILNSLKPLFTFTTTITGVEEAPQEHAPMERIDKTNPIVTVTVILFVMGIIVGGLFWLRRKKLL